MEACQRVVSNFTFSKTKFEIENVACYGKKDKKLFPEN